MGGERLQFRVAPGVIGQLSSAGRHDEGFCYTFTGDLHQMAVTERFLRANGFTIGRRDVYPAVRTEEEYKRALAMLWEYKPEGWHHYEADYVRFGICTHGQFVTALEVRCAPSWVRVMNYSVGEVVSMAREASRSYGVGEYLDPFIKNWKPRHFRTLTGRTKREMRALRRESYLNEAKKWLVFAREWAKSESVEDALGRMRTALTRVHHGTFSLIGTSREECQELLARGAKAEAKRVAKKAA